MAQKYKQEKKREISDETRSVRQCTHPQRIRRQESAKKCAGARAKRTDEQQLNRLDKLLGKNKGAKKERARLNERVKNNESNKQKGGKKIHA